MGSPRESVSWCLQPKNSIFVCRPQMALQRPDLWGCGFGLLADVSAVVMNGFPLISKTVPTVDSIRRHPEVRFNVVINPYNGPGPDARPDEHYSREIPNLTSFANVSLLGYVHLSYGQRPIKEVTRDIQVYADWASQSEWPGGHVDGIFVDETPNQYNPETEQYLREVSEYAKNCGGSAELKVVHNPGCVSAAKYMALADQTIVFEGTFHTFQDRFDGGLLNFRQVLMSQAAESQGSDEELDILLDRSRIGMVIHSVPVESTDEQMAELVDQARALAGSLFMTELDERYYENFSGKWDDWARLIGE